MALGWYRGGQHLPQGAESQANGDSYDDLLDHRHFLGRAMLCEHLHSLNGLCGRHPAVTCRRPHSFTRYLQKPGASASTLGEPKSSCGVSHPDRVPPCILPGKLPGPMLPCLPFTLCACLFSAASRRRRALSTSSTFLCWHQLPGC